MTSLKSAFRILPLLGIFVSGASAFAGPANTLSPCTFNSITLNGMWVTGDSSKTNILASNVQATSCYGVAGMQQGNNPDNLNSSLLYDTYGNYNIGSYDAALLNGGVTKAGDPAYFDPYYLPPNYPSNSYMHVNPVYAGLQSTSTLVDMNGDGVADDPGWILIGKDDGSKVIESIQKDGNSLDLSTVLNFNITGVGSTSGTWELDLDQNIIQEVQSILGPNAFDHLAFAMKSSTGFAIYDFDFTILNQVLGGFDLSDSVFSFSGSWTTQDFLNTSGKPQTLSGMTLWARDPVQPVNDVPEPASLALLGFGLIGLAASRRRRQ